MGAVPGGKADMNNCGGFASDLIGGSYSYPEASYAERKTVWTAHMRYQQGVLLDDGERPCRAIATGRGGAYRVKVGACLGSGLGLG